MITTDDLSRPTESHKLRLDSREKSRCHGKERAEEVDPRKNQYLIQVLKKKTLTVWPWTMFLAVYARIRLENNVE